MEKVIMMIPVLIVVGGLGVVIGSYLAEKIRSNINRKNLIKNLNEEKKTKQQKPKILGQKHVK